MEKYLLMYVCKNWSVHHHWFLSKNPEEYVERFLKEEHNIRSYAVYSMREPEILKLTPYVYNPNGTEYTSDAQFLLGRPRE